MSTETEQENTRASHLRHGQLCYLQIPARDLRQAFEFYAKVLGWEIQEQYASFESPGLIGQWVTDRPPAAENGMLAWFHVDRLDDTLALARAHGGDVVMPPTPDGPRMLATLRDPAGNLLGVAEHGSR
jgi:predicted enzyme related to lactoylglutathione lyase